MSPSREEKRLDSQLGIPLGTCGASQPSDAWGCAASRPCSTVPPSPPGAGLLLCINHILDHYKVFLVCLAQTCRLMGGPQCWDAFKPLLL